MHLKSPLPYTCLDRPASEQHGGRSSSYLWASVTSAPTCSLWRNRTHECTSSSGWQGRYMLISNAWARGTRYAGNTCGGIQGLVRSEGGRVFAWAALMVRVGLGSRGCVQSSWLAGVCTQSHVAGQTQNGLGLVGGLWQPYGDVGRCEPKGAASLPPCSTPPLLK
jgi:hypothetical protein